MNVKARQIKDETTLRTHWLGSKKKKIVRNVARRTRSEKYYDLSQFRSSFAFTFLICGLTL